MAEKPKEKKRRKKKLPHEEQPCKAISTVVGGTIFMIFPGQVYCTSVYATYIQSYYQIPKDNQIVQDLMPICFFLNIFTMSVGSIFIQKGYDPKLQIAVISTITIPLMYSMAFCPNYLGFAICYAVAIALNFGFFYMIGVHNGWLWFPKNPGLVSGIVLMGICFGAIIYDNMFTHLINPDNYPQQPDGFYPAEVNDRF